MLISGCAFLLPNRTIVRRNPEISSKYLRGTFHIHSIFSSDSRARLNRIIKVAGDFDLDFVIVTDHNTLAGQDRYLAMEKDRRPMLIFGSEITTKDGHLIALGIEERPPPGMSSQLLVDWIHVNEGYAVVAHPFSKKRPWTNWKVNGIDGLEIFNFGHTLYGKNKFWLAGASLLFWPRSFLNTSTVVSFDTLRFWDSLPASDSVIALAASDAHLKLFDLPPMRGIFRQALRAVTHYVPAEQFSERAILWSLMQGRGFIVFESMGTAFNFSFEAKTSDQTYHSGQTVATELPLMFFVDAPGAGEIRLIRDGTIANRIGGTSLNTPCSGAGTYRVEVYRREKLWIITNPIYVNQVVSSE